MKKVILSISMIMILLANSFVFAMESRGTQDLASTLESTEEAQIEEKIKSEDQVSEERGTQKEGKQEGETQTNTNVTPASQKILENSSKKDKKIAEYMKKYNDATFAHVAYWLDIVQLYSIPVCIIGITIGAFNFYIIGEKKLEKREKGFSCVMGFLSGLVFFQVLPLIFALLVAGK